MIPWHKVDPIAVLGVPWMGLRLANPENLDDRRTKLVSVAPVSGDVDVVSGEAFPSEQGPSENHERRDFPSVLGLQSQVSCVHCLGRHCLVFVGHAKCVSQDPP